MCSFDIRCGQLLGGILLLGVLVGDRALRAQPFTPSDWKHVTTYDEGFFAPDDFRLLDGEPPTSALVLDHQAPKQALARLRLEDGAPVGRTVRTGRGPGEASGQGMAISQFSNGGVLLWDGGRRQAYVYDADLRFEGQVRGLQELSADPVALINDSTLAVGIAAPRDALFELYRLHRGPESVHITEEPLATVEIPENKAFSQGQLDENIMIRQGLSRRIGGDLYYGFIFGSLVIGMNEGGLTWATTEPVDHSLPVYDFRDGNAVVAPQLNEFARGILDLTGDSSYLYALYSGQKVEDDGVLDRLTGLRAQIEAAKHSDRLFVFDRATGKFVEEMRLPVRAKALEITDQYATLLTTEERDAPTFEVYRIPKSESAP